MDPADLLGNLAPLPLIGVMFWFLYKKISEGLLVPKSTVDMLQAANDRIIASLEKTIASQDRQIESYEDISETTKKTLEDLRKAGVLAVQIQAEASDHPGAVDENV